MIHAYSFHNPVEAHDAMAEQLVYGDQPDRDWDWTHGTEVGLHNVAIHCETIDFDYNLKRLWVPPTRWTMMVRQYLDPVALGDCLDKIEDRMGPPRRGSDTRGISVVRTRLVQGRGVGRGVRRRWGSCMLALSYRNTPEPTVTLHSRTTYFGYLAMVDMAVARTFAEEAAARASVKLEDIRFVWNLELAQFHGFRSLAWMLMDKATRRQMDEDVDRRTEFPSRRVAGNQVGYRKALDGYARILKSDRAGTLYGDESFSSFARVRRRFHTEAFGEYAEQFMGGTRNRGGKGAFPPLPSLMVSDLDFSALRNRSGDESYFDHDGDVTVSDEDDED